MPGNFSWGYFLNLNSNCTPCFRDFLIFQSRMNLVKPCRTKKGAFFVYFFVLKPIVDLSNLLGTTNVGAVLQMINFFAIQNHGENKKSSTGHGNLLESISAVFAARLEIK